MNPRSVKRAEAYRVMHGLSQKSWRRLWELIRQCLPGGKNRTSEPGAESRNRLVSLLTSSVAAIISDSGLLQMNKAPFLLI